MDHGYQPLDQSTYFNEISRFSCGSSLILNFSNNLNNKSKSYYSIYNIKKNNKWDFEDAVNTLKNTLSDAISLRHRSDVELGISISGGIDSSILVQYGFDIHQLKFSKKLKSFSAVSPNMKGDESEFIHQVLNNYDLDSHFINPYKSFNKSDFIKFLKQLEFPPTTTAFYAQWLVSRLMSKKGVKVNLVGQGADEIFGGYHSHYFRYFRTLILKGKIMSYFSEVNAYSEVREVSKFNIHKIVLSDVTTFLNIKLN